ncbi:hypothetical protein KC717_03180, partial [Candidatus Dojkabacteria bacterium]|nr:hypothetical protein [Candidatus Dojkabacteria bacterium]
RVAGAYTDQFYSVSSRTSPERISLDTFNVDKALPIWGVGLIGIAGLSIVYLSIGGKVRTKKLWEL